MMNLNKKNILPVYFIVWIMKSSKRKKIFPPIIYAKINIKINVSRK